MKLFPDFSTKIAGIPCGIKVDGYYKQAPWRGPAHLAPSDLDYYGYTDFDFTVLDRNGYIATWLAKKNDT